MIQSSQIQELLNSMVDAILLVDQHSQIAFSNESCCQLFGYDANSMNQLKLEQLMPQSFMENHHKHVSHFILNNLSGKTMMSRETIPCIKASGESFTAKISLANVKVDGIPYALATIYDFSSIQDLINELRQIAVTDPLTNLFNKRHLNIVIDKQPARLLNSNCTGVAYLDLNDFKQINDTLGHDIGDRILFEIGKRLTKGLRNNDLCFRVGGDEFLVLFPINGYIDYQQEMVGIAQKLHRLISEPLDIEKLGDSISTAVSIGIGSYPHDGQTLTELIEMADKAMYRSKRDKRPYVFISELEQ